LHNKKPDEVCKKSIVADVEKKGVWIVYIWVVEAMYYHAKTC